MSVSVQEAAERLELNPGRVRRLVSQGLLEGRKVGGRWLVEESAINDRRDANARAGRPLSPRSAWGLLSAADKRPMPWLAPRERSRARQRARSWPLDEWSWACRHRAVVHKLRAHPSMLQPLLDDARAVRSGASVRELSVDLIAVGDAELYVREADAPNLINEYSLIPSQQPNVVMRVPPGDLWLFDNGEASWPVVVVDLLDARDDRSVRAANDLARRMRIR
jgi:excisionase family DNA binding protein